jgi:purine-binding chemotaxis protein CheW
MFRLASRTYGIDLGFVREIIPFRPATRLPGAPAYVAGLINVRGSIITVVDLGARLDGVPSACAEGSIILVEQGQKVVGLAVEEVLDVQRLSADRLEAHTDDTGTSAVRALGRLAEGVVILIDVEALIRQVLQ